MRYTERHTTLTPPAVATNAIRIPTANRYDQPPQPRPSCCLTTAIRPLSRYRAGKCFPPQSNKTEQDRTRPNKPNTQPLRSQPATTLRTYLTPSTRSRSIPSPQHHNPSASPRPRRPKPNQFAPARTRIEPRRTRMNQNKPKRTRPTIHLPLFRPTKTPRNYPTLSTRNTGSPAKQRKLGRQPHAGKISLQHYPPAPVTGHARQRGLAKCLNST